MFWYIGKQCTLCEEKTPSIQIKGCNDPTAIIASHSASSTPFKRIVDKLEVTQGGVTRMLIALKAQQEVQKGNGDI